RNQQNLKQISPRQRTKITVRYYREKMRDDALFFRLRDVGCDSFRIDCCWVDIESATRLKRSPNKKPNRERNRRNDLKVNQRLHAHAAHATQIAHRRYAVDDRAENHRRDHHLDECDESIAKWLQGFAGIRIKMANQDS